MLKKLRIKLICFTMALVMIMLCVIFTTGFFFTKNRLEQDSLSLMQSLLNAHNTPLDRDDRDRPKDRDDCDRPKVRDNRDSAFRPQISVPYLTLQQSPQGDWLVHGSNYYSLDDPDFIDALLEAADATGSDSGILKEYGMRFLRKDMPALQYVFLDTSVEQTTMYQFLRLFVFISLGCLVLFFGISLLLAEVALRPVEKAWQQQNQFIADASHELKTPLAVILTNAELLPDNSYSPDEHQQFGQNILLMAHQMRHLVENLLDLARLDNITPVIQPLDLTQLVEATLLPFEPVFFEQELLLETTLAPNLWVKGSASHLRQVLEVFLDNALKYSDPGTVTVKLEASGCHVLLSVENPGTPLSPEEAKNVFLRFYRSDPSRNRNGSYGLGLSIAQKIIDQHGGKIWAVGIPGGNRFCVLLPLCHRENT